MAIHISLVYPNNIRGVMPCTWQMLWWKCLASNLCLGNYVHIQQQWGRGTVATHMCDVFNRNKTISAFQVESWNSMGFTVSFVYLAFIVISYSWIKTCISSEVLCDETVTGPTELSSCSFMVAYVFIRKRDLFKELTTDLQEIVFFSFQH